MLGLRRAIAKDPGKKQVAKDIVTSYVEIATRSSRIDGSGPIGTKSLRATVLSDRGDDVLNHSDFDNFGESTMGGDLFSSTMIGEHA